MAVDKPGVLAKISGVLAKLGISIASVTQKERRQERIVPIVMIIHQAREKNLREALQEISRIDAIKEKPVAIRIEEV
jgi:homoserine dehydrogenase